MAALPVEDLYRAAVRAALPDADDLRVRELARTLLRLTTVLDKRPGGTTQITLEYQASRAQPAIRPWRGVWGELD